MCELKTLPLDQLVRYVYPDFYHLDGLFLNANQQQSNGDTILTPPRLQLSAE